MSSGVPSRPSGTTSICFCARGPDMNSALSSVSTSPGATALTRMPRWPHSTAMVPVRFSTPALAAPYWPVIGLGCEPEREVMLMMAPPAVIARGTAGIVDPDIEPAEFRQRPVDDGLRRAALGDVVDKAPSPAASLPYQRRGRPERRRGAPCADHGSTCLRQGMADSLADTAPAAGHHRDLSRQREHGFLLIVAGRDQSPPTRSPKSCQLLPSKRINCHCLIGP